MVFAGLAPTFANTGSSPADQHRMETVAGHSRIGLGLQPDRFLFTDSLAKNLIGCDSKHAFPFRIALCRFFRLLTSQRKPKLLANQRRRDYTHQFNPASSLGPFFKDHRKDTIITIPPRVPVTHSGIWMNGFESMIIARIPIA